ncbi:hypothetical protein KHQ08_07045 [Pseudochrobactrum algeriensis]|uniref:hypothetical protein n=1 Tax=Pseudochrobactrum TaxID=354349 RepID=UPI001BCAEDDB|nr:MULTISPECIES: hypothetical protein [Pseudochrobactrum]MDM8346259.1 hypothetical protein [Pseudochrobactrum sp. sp1633]QVQ37771.1 hypothetical protein KHQ08_07045 [Pseudochrobactrum algeriensis]QVQ40991.1 hypothetical protein KHQ07_05345 [Pseudochrobactrum algeriensis]QVQ44915.1 hypothetical protein KHQ09_07310 [Pseudochrobactrum algeriensis]
MSSTSDIPKNAAAAKAHYEDKHKERGMLGKFFGGKEHAPTNIAGFLLLLSIVAVIFLLWLSAAYPNARLSEAIVSFFTVITTTIGFIFGRQTSE